MRILYKKYYLDYTKTKSFIDYISPFCKQSLIAVKCNNLSVGTERISNGLESVDSCISH